MKRLILALLGVALSVLFVLVPKLALAESNPRSVSIVGIDDNEVAFIGSVRGSGWGTTVEVATWVTIITSEALTITFNNAGYLDGPVAAVKAGVSVDYEVSSSVPLAAAGTYLFSCNATTITFTDCDAGNVTIYAEYRKGS
jgi:hypothetical protein